MATKPIQISLGETFKLLVQEFEDALSLVKRSHPTVAVRSVKVNIGQADEQAAGEEEPAPAPELILSDRYPGIDKGWQLQLELGERPAASLKGVPQQLPGVYVPTALDLYTEHPIGIIKGIDAEWTQFFAHFEISRVRHLARMDDQTLQELVAARHSLKPREFRCKAGLIETSIPLLPKSDLDGKTLYQLLLLSMEEVHEAFGVKRTALSEVTALYGLLENLTVAIDSRILQQTRLSQLLDCWGDSTG
jgi:hypothetical protein